MSWIHELTCSISSYFLHTHIYILIGIHFVFFTIAIQYFKLCNQLRKIISYQMHSLLGTDLICIGIAWLQIVLLKSRLCTCKAWLCLLSAYTLPDITCNIYPCQNNSRCLITGRGSMKRACDCEEGYRYNSTTGTCQGKQRGTAQRN